MAREATRDVTPLEDPYGLLGTWLGGPLHPGGADATEELLRDADVGPGDRLLDLGCGAGAALDAARDLGARPVGLDAQAPGGQVQGTMTGLPFADGAFDVALAECTLCLAGDLDRTLHETRRVLVDDGRLAFSDVTLAEPLELPTSVARAACVDRARPRDDLIDTVERSGFDPTTVRDRTADLRTFRDRVRDRIDLEGLLEAMGRPDLRDACTRLEDALDDGRLGYVACVARRV